MPAINFKEQFAGLVKSGDKTTTIRRRCFKPGSKLFLYTGLRTKDCQKIGEGECLFSIPVNFSISQNIHGGKVLCSVSLVDMDWRYLFPDYKPEARIMPKAIDFEHQRMTVSLAKMEGFADVYSFFAFFKQNYGGYFEGYLTKWRLI